MPNPLASTPKPSTLVATLGGQSQVITFALDDLLRRGEVIDTVIIVYIQPNAPRMQKALAQLAEEFKDGQYQGRACKLRRMEISDNGRALDAIDNEDLAELTWQSIHRLLINLKQDGHRLHLCIAGGPRMIGLMAMSAANLHFEHQDRLWHLYTPPNILAQAQDGALRHVTPESGVTLVQVPIAPWGAYFPALRTLTQVTSTQVIANQTELLDRDERQRCALVMERLTPRQQDVLKVIAQGKTPQDVAEALSVTLKTVDNHKSAIFAECRNAWGMADDARLTYYFLREKFGRYFQI